MASTQDNSAPASEEERYTTSDAAEFSRQGACMTAFPPDEVYQLPRIKDIPPATGSGEQQNPERVRVYARVQMR
jgi:hypothetical protein